MKGMESLSGNELYQQLFDTWQKEQNERPQPRMTKEDEDFLINNDFNDPPPGLTDAQEKAYVDVLRENPENHDEIYERFEDVAYADAYERGL